MFSSRGFLHAFRPLGRHIARCNRLYSRGSYAVRNNRNKLPLTCLLGTGGALIYLQNTIKSDQKSDLNEKTEDTISVESSLSPFPTFLEKKNQTNLNSNYELLGYGVRTVTFLSFKVYGIGLYISSSDITKARKIIQGEMKQNFGNPQVVEDTLRDPTRSEAVVAKLLENDVKFAVRISPIRNTDFNHLKDGLIKSILAHPLSKEVGESLSEGLNELREAFQKKRKSVPKDHALWLEILPGGKLSVTYEDTKKNELSNMGIVNEPLVTKLLFLRYLTGKKPLSEPLRSTCVSGLAHL